MPSVFKKALTLITGVEQPDGLVMLKNRPLKGLTGRELIQLESEIGAQLFGSIPTGHRREFFNLDASTWIWHEEWLDAESGKMLSTTTRYEIHDNGILKAQEGARYNFIEGEELQNLALAVQMYYERVMRDVYHRDPQTGQKLS
ncbi:MAG: hypothetical protein ACSLEY_03635 [Candidatus Saccharimonadales bacterium]